tara:strand:+ start:1677 stop:1991 length:315 start_codon:yes stop_codon:yes gene_type:complete
VGRRSESASRILAGVLAPSVLVELNFDFRPAAGFAGNFQSTAMQLDQLLGQRQLEATAVLFDIQGSVDLSEGFKCNLDISHGHADALVLDYDGFTVYLGFVQGD